MKRLAIVLVFFMVWGLYSCTSDKLSTTPYNNHGVAFDIPEGWLKKEMPIPDEGNYILVERQGEDPADESGQFIVSILNKTVPLGAYMQLMRQQLSQQMALTKDEISFTETEVTEFAGKEALKAQFKFDQLEKSYRGVLQTFHCGGKTIYLFVQEAEEDAAKNADGLDILQNSLACIE